MFDTKRLEQLRQEAELNGIDFTRGHVRESQGGGYTVAFDKPLFDCAPVLAYDDVPTERYARTAGNAEGELLTGLLVIQRAERQKLRIGRSFGLSGEQISRRPLTAAEVDEFLADLEHRKQVSKLQKELAQVLESNAASAANSAGADDLKGRYGLTGKVAPKLSKSTPSAKPHRAPSRSGVKS